MGLSKFFIYINLYWIQRVTKERGEGIWLKLEITQKIQLLQLLCNFSTTLSQSHLIMNLYSLKVRVETPLTNLKSKPEVTEMLFVLSVYVRSLAGQ